MLKSKLKLNRSALRRSSIIARTLTTASNSPIVNSKTTDGKLQGNGSSRQIRRKSFATAGECGYQVLLNPAEKI